VKLFDLDSGINRSLVYTCLLDFEDPLVNIALGDGITDYSLNNAAAPWTPFILSCSDNLEGTIDHNTHYYDEIIEKNYQLRVFDIYDDLVYISGFSELVGSYSILFDLGAPYQNFYDSSKYYYMIDFMVSDAAGNTILNSSYLGDLYPYEGGSPKINISDQFSIQIHDYILNVEDIYNGIENFLNFTLIGPDGLEIKNKNITLFADGYFLNNVVWDDLTQSYKIYYNDLLIF